MITASDKLAVIPGFPINVSAMVFSRIGVLAKTSESKTFLPMAPRTEGKENQELTR